MAPLANSLKPLSRFKITFSYWIYYAYVSETWCKDSLVILFWWKLLAKPSASCVSSASLWDYWLSLEAVKLLASTEKILRSSALVEVQFPAKSSRGTTY
jgi:hypothetical protein